MKRIFTLFVSFFVFSNLSFSQNYDRKEFRRLFEEGNIMILDHFYDTALSTFLRLHKMDSLNANVNYKVGFLLLKTATMKVKAIPYLERASKSITKKYMEFEASEKKAPPSSLFLLAQAYHFDYRFDEAISFFEKYREYVNPKDVETLKDLNLRIRWAKNGKELVANPIGFVITNLGDSVNSPYPDYSPVISADESIIYFTSRRNGGQGGENNKTIDLKYFEDIWYCEKKEDGTWSAAKNMGPIVNSLDHEATIGLSADGSQLYIYKDVMGDGGIFISELNGTTWSVPDKLGNEPGDITDINSKDWETHACISADGRTLYFVSDRKGGLGGRDIWKCVKLPNGRWSKAVNLGSEINTPFDDDAPFIHPDGKTLFFSSKGHKSMGGFDIFFSSLGEDGKWKEPTNMGYPVNTTDDDIYYVVSTDGKRAYFSSFREGSLGEKDIYMATIPTPVVEPVALLIGFIKTASGEPLPGDIVVKMTSIETGDIKDYRVNSSSGKYIISLPPGKEYTLTLEVDGNVVYSENIKTPFTDYLSEGKEKFLKTIILNGTTAMVEDPDKGKDPEKPKDPIQPKDPIKPKDPIVVKDPKKNIDNPKDKPKDKPKNVSDGQPRSVPLDTSAADFSKYFTYNKKDINEEGERFLKFMDRVEQELKDRGKIRILITSCASKVPTGKLYGGDNGKLALSRAVEAEAEIRKALKERGLDVKSVEFRVFYKVRGPDYKGDFIENREVYEQFQYTKVYIR